MLITDPAAAAAAALGVPWPAGLPAAGVTAAAGEATAAAAGIKMSSALPAHAAVTAA
jgi:hypothetical protein